MKKLAIVLVFIVSLCSSAYSQTAKEKMDDSLGRAYKAATENKADIAKDSFKKALQYAKEANIWQGMVDAGYGLSTLGLPDEAKNAFDSASPIITQQKDWHGAIALGYAFASLPKSGNNTESASQMWSKGKNWANDSGDWTGLIEAGRGFMSINNNKEAEACFDMARDIIKDIPTDKGIKAIVQAYRKLGKEDKALECASMQPETQGPPPGWVPTVGESVRGTKTVPIEVQLAQRESIDKDIVAKRQWESEDAQRAHEQKMQKQELAYQAYRDYLTYYSYPYYGNYGGYISNYDDYYMYSWTPQPLWAVRTYDEVYNWGLWNLGRYTYSNGVYIAVDIY